VKHDLKESVQMYEIEVWILSFPHRPSKKRRRALHTGREIGRERRRYERKSMKINHRQDRKTVIDLRREISINRQREFITDAVLIFEGET
jgi:hypothetical protein